MPWNSKEEKALLIKNYNLEDRLLPRKCTEDHMHDIAEFISWKKVGRRLQKIERHDIEDIVITNKKRGGNCLISGRREMVMMLHMML